MTSQASNASGGSSSKHMRTKSIPTSLQHAVTSSSGGAGAPTSSLNSRVAQSHERNSPKPKRGFFEGLKNPLRSKKHNTSSDHNQLTSKSSSHLPLTSSSHLAATNNTATSQLVKSSSHLPASAFAPANNTADDNKHAVTSSTENDVS